MTFDSERARDACVGKCKCKCKRDVWRGERGALREPVARTCMIMIGNRKKHLHVVDVQWVRGSIFILCS